MDLHTYQADVIIDLETMEQCKEGKRIIEATPLTLVDADGQPEGRVDIFSNPQNPLDIPEPLKPRTEYGLNFSVAFAVMSTDRAFVEKYLRTEVLDYFKDAPQVYADVNCIDPEPPCFTIEDYSDKERERIKREHRLVKEYRERERAEWHKQMEAESA